MIGYVIIGIFAVVLLYIVVLYLINSKKIKNKDKKTSAKVEEKKSGDVKLATPKGKVEVESKIIKGTMFEEAVKEAEKAGYKYQQTKEASKSADNCRLKLDREEFVSEIQKQKTQKPEEKKAAMSNENTTSKTIARDIKNLSPELKALLVNDVLNRKY